MSFALGFCLWLCVSVLVSLQKKKKKYTHVVSLSPFVRLKYWHHTHTATCPYMQSNMQRCTHSVRKWMNLSYNCEIVAIAATSFLFFALCRGVINIWTVLLLLLIPRIDPRCCKWQERGRKNTGLHIEQQSATAFFFKPLTKAVLLRGAWNWNCDFLGDS